MLIKLCRRQHVGRARSVEHKIKFNHLFLGDGQKNNSFFQGSAYPAIRHYWPLAIPVLLAVIRRFTSSVDQSNRYCNVTWMMNRGFGFKHGLWIINFGYIYMCVVGERFCVSGNCVWESIGIEAVTDGISKLWKKKKLDCESREIVAMRAGKSWRWEQGYLWEIFGTSLGNLQCESGEILTLRAEKSWQ